MSPEILRKFHHASPFVPFLLRTADRRTFHVPHEDYFSVSPTGRVAIVFLQTGGHATLDTTTISEIEPEKVDQPTNSPSADA